MKCSWIGEVYRFCQGFAFSEDSEAKIEHYQTITTNIYAKNDEMEVDDVLFNDDVLSC